MPSERLTSHIRLSPSLKKRLKVAAAESGRSLNEEVSLRLEGSFALTDDQRGKAVALLTDALSVLEKGSG